MVRGGKWRECRADDKTVWADAKLGGQGVVWRCRDVVCDKGLLPLSMI
jgi:hypothetical protein